MFLSNLFPHFFPLVMVGIRLYTLGEIMERGIRKMPIRRLQGDPDFPFGASSFMPAKGI
jgi:hypothetical protein